MKTLCANTRATKIRNQRVFHTSVNCSARSDGKMKIRRTKKCNERKLDVFLMGGGLKGAYQYGFFKRVYDQYPDIPVNNVYGVSVGAINAVAILLKDMTILDYYWQNESPEELHPFDTIMNHWDTDEGFGRQEYGILNHISMFVTNLSLFHSVNRSPFEDLWNFDLTASERELIRKKLHLIAFDSKNNKMVVISNISNAIEFSSAIIASTNFPGLVKHTNTDKSKENTSSPQSYIDGIFADNASILKYIINSDANHQDSYVQQLLVLNIQQDIDVFSMSGPSVITNMDDTETRMSNHAIIDVYGPNWKKYGIGFWKGQLLSCCASKEEVDMMVSMGMEDAESYLHDQLWISNTRYS